ncbi:extracellular solute-binding protein [Citreicella sp. C3M06]|uniref:extracellular solute-binding protein n=1 Tax=Citreicella sp. C3M06 TaxID=2841564 RepID=UPI001C092ADC|nr:extracellular solute-binding protein [Citreicella sp. C3M06]MBU2959348.1 extracellular solute-binding protein [Citreicella sp. C3M06]
MNWKATWSVAALSLALSGAATAQDFAGQTLVVGTWGGDIERLLREHAARPLEEKTGAKVEFLLGGSGDRMAKMYAEKSNPTMDVTFQNIYEAPQALADGLVMAPDESSPIYSDLWSGMNDGCYAMSLVGLGIAYNKDLVEEPVEWADMWDPAVKGMIAMAPYPSSEGDGLLGVAARLEGSDEHDPDTAFAKVRELGAPALNYTSLDEVFALMDAGEVAMAPMISGYVLAALKEWDNIGFAFPTDPGPVLVRDMVCQVANSPNPELAAMFIELALSPETQQAYAEELLFGPTNSKAVLSAQAAADTINTPEEVESLLQLDWPYVISQRSDWTERWNKDVLGQ